MRSRPTATTGSSVSGQGHETTFAQIVADRLDMPVEQVEVIKGDTDQVARGTGTYGSKSTQIGGAAAGEAASEVREVRRGVRQYVLDGGRRRDLFRSHVLGLFGIKRGGAL